MKNQTYEEFYLKYRKISRAYAYGVLHDWNISDDVSQDVLYKMYTKRKHLNIDNEKMMYSLIRKKNFCVKRRINLCIWYWKDFVRSSLLIMTF